MINNVYSPFQSEANIIELTMDNRISAVTERGRHLAPYNIRRF